MPRTNEKMPARGDVNRSIGGNRRRYIDPDTLQPTRLCSRLCSWTRRPRQLGVAEYTEAFISRRGSGRVETRIAENTDRVVWSDLHQPRIDGVLVIEVAITLQLEHVVIDVPAAVRGQRADGEDMIVKVSIRCEKLRRNDALYGCAIALG